MATNSILMEAYLDSMEDETMLEFEFSNPFKTTRKKKRKSSKSKKRCTKEDAFESLELM